MNPEPATILSVTEIVTTKRCSASKARGDQCTNPNLAWFDGPGWRCPFHMPEGAEWPKKAYVPKGSPEPLEPTEVPNAGRIIDIKTALDMIAWATENLASGALPESRARGVINGARQYMRGIATTAGADMMNDLERAAVAAGALPKPK